MFRFTFSRALSAAVSHIPHRPSVTSKGPLVCPTGLRGYQENAGVSSWLSLITIPVLFLQREHIVLLYILLHPPFVSSAFLSLHPSSRRGALLVHSLFSSIWCTTFGRTERRIIRTHHFIGILFGYLAAGNSEAGFRPIDPYFRLFG